MFEHALRTLAASEGYAPDLVVHLRPTSPLRPKGLVDEGVRALAADPDADSLRAVTPPANNPYKMWRIVDGVLVPLVETDIHEQYNQPRQALPAAYWQTGTLDVMRAATVLDLRVDDRASHPAAGHRARPGRRHRRPAVAGPGRGPLPPLRPDGGLTGAPPRFSSRVCAPDARNREENSGRERRAACG